MRIAPGICGIWLMLFGCTGKKAETKPNESPDCKGLAVRLDSAFRVAHSEAQRSVGMIASRSQRENDRMFLAPGEACAEPQAVGALVFATGGSFSLHCTATLMDDGMVLTAAHCVKGIHTEGMEFRIGDIISKPKYVAHVVETTPNKEYYPACGAPGDIAVLSLDCIPPVDPIGLRDEQAQDGSVLRFAGYGASNFKGVYGNGIRHCTDLKIKGHGNTFNYELAAPQVCDGDSGGPALQMSADRLKIAGVTSWGDEACEKHGVSVDTGAYYTWIKEVAGELRKRFLVTPDTKQNKIPPGSSFSCDVSSFPPSEKKCVVYVSSSVTADAAQARAEDICRGGFPDVEIWHDGNSHYVTTICGEMLCEKARIIRNRAKVAIEPSANLYYTEKEPPWKKLKSVTVCPELPKRDLALDSRERCAPLN